MSRTPAITFEEVSRYQGLPSGGTHLDVISFFPWSFEDYKRLSWPNFEWTDNNIARWGEITKRWKGVAALCGKAPDENKVILVRTTPSGSKPLQLVREFHLDNGDTDDKNYGLRALTWSLDHKTLSPLVLAAGFGRIIWVVEVQSGQLVSILRGHGERITSLTSNPLNPQIIASTSCDKTTRLWSLDLPSSMIMEADDPEAAGRGPPFGSPMTGGEAEALGIGKCFAIFIGGFTTSGHKAAVMDAHFHPSLNLCVTSSVDHSIKIWEYPPPPQADAPKATLINITRPVFGTNMIHAAAVICIHWLSPSILISQSQESEVTHFTDTTSREVTETERLTFPSKIVVWEWLGYETYRKAVTRGQFYVKDYFNAAQSRSYKVLAETHVGHTGKKLTFWGLTAVLTTKARIRIIDPTRLFLGRRPHTERPFKLDDLYTNDHDQWEEVLKMWKKDLWKQSEELESQIGIATVSVTSSDKENVFSAALYRNILLRVGQYEQMTLWKAVPKDAAV